MKQANIQKFAVELHAQSIALLSVITKSTTAVRLKEYAKLPQQSWGRKLQ